MASHILAAPGCSIEAAAIPLRAEVARPALRIVPPCVESSLLTRSVEYVQARSAERRETSNTPCICRAVDRCPSGGDRLRRVLNTDITGREQRHRARSGTVAAWRGDVWTSSFGSLRSSGFRHREPDSNHSDHPAGNDDLHHARRDDDIPGERREQRILGR